MSFSFLPHSITIFSLLQIHFNSVDEPLNSDVASNAVYFFFQPNSNLSQTLTNERIYEMLQLIGTFGEDEKKIKNFQPWRQRSNVDLGSFQKECRRREVKRRGEERRGEALSSRLLLRLILSFFLLFGSPCSLPDET